MKLSIKGIAVPPIYFFYLMDFWSFSYQTTDFAISVLYKLSLQEYNSTEMCEKVKTL